MSDYIKREDAKKWLTNLREDCGRYQDLWPYAEALDQIIELFSVDVAPVKHGWWDVVDFEEPRRWGCSECYVLSWDTSRYCPRCGAKMEGERFETD